VSSPKDVVLFPAAPPAADVRLRVNAAVVAGGAAYAVAVTEVQSAADSQAGVAAFAGGGSDALTGVATESASATFAASVAESASAAESSTGFGAFAGANTEALTATDSQAGALVIAAIVAESLAGTESQTAPGIFLADAAEQLASTDSGTGLTEFVVTPTETLALTETQDGAIAGPPVVYDVAVAEMLSVRETIDASSGTTTDVSGGGGWSGTYVTFASPRPVRAFLVEQGDHLTMRERQEATVIAVAALRDRLVLTESSEVTGDFPAGLVEALDATDRVESTAALLSAIDETGALRDDGTSGVGEFEGMPADLLTVVDQLIASAAFAPSLVEALAATDSAFCDHVLGTFPPAPWSPEPDPEFTDDEEALLAYLMTA
jgi:hypothetical protein